MRDLELFFDVMDANEDRDVYVHCFANMRVSVFVYLYRTLRKGVPDAEAWQDVLKSLGPAKQPRDPPVAPLHRGSEEGIRGIRSAGLQTGIAARQSSETRMSDHPEVRSAAGLGAACG